MTHKERKAVLSVLTLQKSKVANFPFPLVVPLQALVLKYHRIVSSTAHKGEGLSQLHPKQLSTLARSCGISTLHFATLDAMWSKAEEYLNSSKNVVPPGVDPKSKMVTSHTGNTPHFVRMLSCGQYVCDKNCLQWSSSRISSHTLEAAEVNGKLKLFLENSSKNSCVLFLDSFT